MRNARSNVAALTRFEKAVRAHAFMGTQHPGDHASIEKEYQEARASLLRHLNHEPNAKTQEAMAEIRARRT